MICESSSNDNNLLAPGFRFHPTDEELVSYYLKRKVSGLPLRVEAIAEIDLYKKEPWELPSLSRLQSRDMEWYFFSPLDRKYSNRTRTNRGTVEGYWKTTGKDRPVKHAYSNAVVGMKKTLVFHQGRAPKGMRTNWVMHEYRLESSDSNCNDSTALVHPQDSFVVCRIFQKNGSGPQNGAQYGAPFIAEEWEEGQIALKNEEANTCTALMDPNANEQPDIDHKNIMLENTKVVSESNSGQSHMDDQTPLDVVDDQIADHVSGSGEQATDSHADDLTFSLEELFDFGKQDNVLDNMQDGLTITNNMVADNSGIAVEQNDGYFELNDIFENANEPGTCSSIDGLVATDVANDVTAFPETDGCEISNNYNGIAESVFNMQPDDFLNSLADDYLDDGTLFFDAHNNDLPYTDDTIMDTSQNIQFSPTSDLPSFDLVDDLMAYFDATENNIPYDTDSPSLDKLELVNPAKATQPNIVSEDEDSSHHACDESLVASGNNIETGASSTRFGDAAYAFESANKNNTTATDMQVNNGWNKSAFRKRVVDMLGSISAPPAMADDPCNGKAIQLTSSGSSSTIRVSAGMIQIRGISVMGSPENWSLQKNGEISFFYTYANGTAGKSACFEPPATLFGGLLRGGFYLLGIFAIVLSISFKLGRCIYSN